MPQRRAAQRRGVFASILDRFLSGSSLVPAKPGDRVKFFVHPDGSVVLLPKLPIKALKLKGIAKRLQQPATIEDMHEAVIAGANEGILRGPRR